MSVYMQFGDAIAPNGKSGVELEKLPAGTYRVAVSQQLGWHFVKSSMGDAPKKIYGDVLTRTNRIMQTFFSRSERGANTGIMLSGDKGSGKSLLAKFVAKSAADHEIPTIVIDNSFDGNSDFIDLISKINQPVVILFDEFDKVFPRTKDQEPLLTLIDGMGHNGKLFIFTRNDGYLSEFFINRPSRIFYSFNYSKISKEAMMEYLEDTLKNKDNIKHFDKLYEALDKISFDIVQSIAEELNRYPDCSFAEALHLMDIEVAPNVYNVTSFKVKDHLLKMNLAHVGDEINHEELMSGESSIYFETSLITDEEAKLIGHDRRRSSYFSYTFEKGDVIDFSGKHIRIKRKDMEIELTRRQSQTYNFSSMFGGYSAV